MKLLRSAIVESVRMANENFMYNEEKHDTIPELYIYVVYAVQPI